MIYHTDPFLVWKQGKNNDVDNNNNNNNNNNNDNNNDNNNSNNKKTTFVLPLKSTKTAN